jgi:hypothetical protein
MTPVDVPLTAQRGRGESGTNLGHEVLDRRGRRQLNFACRDAALGTSRPEGLWGGEQPLRREWRSETSAAGTSRRFGCAFHREQRVRGTAPVFARN